MRRIVAGDIAEIALDAFRGIDSGDGAEGKIEVLEVRDARQAFAAEVA